MDPSGCIPTREQSLGPCQAPSSFMPVGAFCIPGGDVSRPVTASMAVQCMKMLDLPVVSQSTIRTWAERGKVRRYGLDQYGLQKYELADIIGMASGVTLKLDAS